MAEERGDSNATRDMQKAERKKRKREKKDSKDAEKSPDNSRERTSKNMAEERGDSNVTSDMPKVKRKQRKREKKDSKDAEKSPDNSPERTSKNMAEERGDSNVTSDMQKVEKKKRRREKKDSKDAKKSPDNSRERTSKNMAEERGDSNVTSDMQKVEREKRKREKKDIKDAERSPDNPRKRPSKKKKIPPVENGLHDDSALRKSNKKVSFSKHVEIFGTAGNSSNPQNGLDDGDDLVRGKRFTPEEDEIVKSAVNDYILRNDLGDDGLEMVLESKKHPNVRGCWKEIGSAIPYRPNSAVYYRAQVLFRRSENRKWTKEEYETVLAFYKEHGRQWRKLADELGKHRFHVKDTWRRIKMVNRKKGHWSQHEYQKLFDLVNTDLQARFCEEKHSKYGMLRDNICWTAISDELSTRSDCLCCMKWYQQLTSPMVAEGVWTDTDDYRLIDWLYGMDLTCIEDVEWDEVVEGRSGELCRKRWNQMALHLGRNGHKPFAEQVEVLAHRYCPYLLEAREAWDNKPRVP